MTARRLFQVVIAVAGVMVVAVLARPSDPQAPAPFEIERATPTPAPSPVATAEPTGEAGDATAAPAPGTRPGPRAVVHAFDPRTLSPLAEPLELDFDRQGAVGAVASPDGRHLAVLPIPATPGETELALYDLGDLHAPPRLHDGLRGAGSPRFAPDSGALVWQDFSTQGAPGVGGLRLDGDDPPERLHDVALPEGLLVSGVTPLHGGRAGVHGYSVRHEDGQEDGAGGPPRGPASGPLRLLVVDLAAGRVELDVTLPTAEGSVPAEVDSGAWLERQAGVAWDPDRDRAYAAHADRDAVLVVDLASGEVVTELAAASPAVVAVGAAEARWREATLAAGGELLYVSGAAVELPPASGDHQPGPGMRELPVLVVELATGALAATHEARGRVLAASPGGEHVALVTDVTHGDEPHVLRLHDGRSLEPHWERGVGFVLQAAFLQGEEHLLLFSADDGGAIGHPGNGWAVGEGRGRLDAVDLASGEVTRTVRFRGEWWQVDLRAGVVVEVHFE